MDCEVFDASTKTEERRVDDGLGGLVLWSRRSGGGLLGGENGSGKARKLFSEHWRFVGCQRDEVFVKESLPGLAEVYAR